jgi:putative peptide maturation dehydrogenase
LRLSRLRVRFGSFQGSSEEEKHGQPSPGRAEASATARTAAATRAHAASGAVTGRWQRGAAAAPHGAVRTRARRRAEADADSAEAAGATAASTPCGGLRRDRVRLALPRARRTAYLFVHGEGDPPFVTSGLTAETAPLGHDQLTLLFSVPQAEWAEVADSRRIRELGRRGLLLLELDDEPFAEPRRRDELLSAVSWHPGAAAFHFSTRLRDSDLALPFDPWQIAADADRAAAQFVERHGPPPGHFHSVGGETVELPAVPRTGGLYEALARRRTTRGFDPGRPVTLEQLAVVLYEAFGCRAVTHVHGDEIVALRKGSPSGGGLHPVEAYPVLRNVEAASPGLYHYSVRDHALELVLPLDGAQATEAISSFTTGQSYFAAAAAAIVLTGRFERSFWKYREHPTAYASVLMDAAALAQTLYLVCAELDLGAFFTNLLNAKNVEEALGLDGCREGAVAVAGFGVPAAQSSPLDPEFVPYVPGKTAR